MPNHLKTMKVVGGANLPPYWERFDRLQRTANLLLGRPVSPRGIFRFKTYEEFEEWKRRIHLEHRNKPT
jgi:hypothetical protein